ncbi:MAG: hypothetical protein ACYSQY_04730 [Planctomycetota bacterium]|jgi:hypothetical protein
MMNTTEKDRQRAEEVVSAIEHFVHRYDQIERNLYQAMDPVIRAFSATQEIVIIRTAEERRRISEVLVDKLDTLGFKAISLSPSGDIHLDDLGYNQLKEAFESCRFLLYRYAKSPSSVNPINAVDAKIFKLLKSAKEIVNDFCDIQSTLYWDWDRFTEPKYTKVLACLPERRLYRMAAAAEVYAAIDDLSIKTLIHPLETQTPNTKQKSPDKPNISRVQKQVNEKTLLISTLLHHHKFDPSDNELIFDPAIQTVIGKQLNWNQSKVSRVLERNFPEGFWKRYTKACKTDALKGFLKALDNEQMNPEPIDYRPQHPTEREERLADKYQ